MCAEGGGFYPSSMSWSEVAEPRPGGRAGRPRRRSSDGQLLGLLLLGFGVAALLRESGALDIKWEAIFAGLLILLGMGLVLTARSGGRFWPLALGIVLILSLSAHSPSLNLHLPASSAGSRTVRVQVPSQLEPSYNQGFGDLTLDLRQVALAPGTTTQVSINDGVGDVKVRLAEGMEVELNGNLGFGEAVVLGKSLGHGPGVEVRYHTPAFGAPDHASLSLQVHIGLGHLEVVR